MGLEEKTFKKGEVIIKEGDTGKSFYQLLEGRVGVYADYTKKEPFRLAILGAGEFFGEMAILEEYPRSATVVAESNVSVAEITEDEMNAYFEKNPDQIIELIKHLGNRIQSMASDYEEAEALLKEMRASDNGKNNASLFSKIKKHINTYQINKNKITEPSPDSLREALDKVRGKESGDIRSYSKGMIIFKEGNNDNCMYILHKGAVGMYSDYRRREEVKLAEMSAVAFFGEMGIISDGPRSVSAVAETGGTTVEIVHPEDLETMIKTCPEKIDMILRHLSYRLRRLNIDFIAACKEITETYNRK